MHVGGSHHVSCVLCDAGAGVQDWYVTVIEGLAGGTIPALPSGVRPRDGHNLWPALLGQNLKSPRTEVIHAVHNQYADDPSLHQQP